MWGLVNRALRDDRGEGSIMVVISQLAGTIVLASFFGVFTVLLIGAPELISQTNDQSALTIANRAFDTDVANASTVSAIDDKSVTFTSTNFLPTGFLDSGGYTIYACREAKWSIIPASSAVRTAMKNDNLMALAESITVHTDTSCSSSIKSVQNRVAIASVTPDTAFSYKNIAGVPLDYSNGVVTNFAGLDPTSTDSADAAAVTNFRSANNVSDHYLDTEMLSEQPKTVRLTLSDEMPFSTSATQFEAATGARLAALPASNGDIAAPDTMQLLWIPNALKIPTVTRSTTTGNIVNGQHEGISISWQPRPASECEPDATPTYMWVVHNEADGSQSSGETTDTSVQVASTPGGANIATGDVLEVAVSNRCDDTSGQSPYSGFYFILN
jgi:hypothetical protein